MNLLFLKAMLKIRQTMQKMIPPTPKAYINATAATLKTLRTVIVDPSGGIPSVALFIALILEYIYCTYTVSIALAIVCHTRPHSRYIFLYNVAE